MSIKDFDDSNDTKHPTSVRNSVRTIFIVGPASWIWAACSKIPTAEKVRNISCESILMKKNK